MIVRYYCIINPCLYIAWCKFVCVFNPPVLLVSLLVDANTREKPAEMSHDSRPRCLSRRRETLGNEAESPDELDEAGLSANTSQALNHGVPSLYRAGMTDRWPIPAPWLILLSDKPCDRLIWSVLRPIFKLFPPQICLFLEAAKA